MREALTTDPPRKADIPAANPGHLHPVQLIHMALEGAADFNESK